MRLSEYLSYGKSKKFAEMLGISPFQLSRIKNGKHPTFALALKISNATRGIVSLEDLLGPIPTFVTLRNIEAQRRLICASHEENPLKTSSDSSQIETIPLSFMGCAK